MSPTLSRSPRPAVALALAALVAFSSAPVLATPTWGDKTPQPAETPPQNLKPGQFKWKGGAIPSGPIVVVVSLAEQRAYVYRNGVRVGVAAVSTGKPGHGTPTGVFTVLEKDVDHRSKTYNDAPMPYMQRLTWSGVALHAGGLPGYPSSHGCVHLPTEFARLLYAVSPKGMTVVIADRGEDPTEVVHPAALSPVDARTGKPVQVPRLSAREDYRWRPAASPTGPLSVVMSRADKRVLVYRNGVEIGRAKISVDQPGVPLGTHAFIMQDGWTEGASAIVKDAPAHRWTAVGIPGHADERGQSLSASHRLDRIHLPPQFARTLYDILTPGTTLLITDAPVLPKRTTGVALSIMNADKPQS
jgi:lipoprotein-anchoring transpeptidase ErfK/SrfK